MNGSAISTAAVAYFSGTGGAERVARAFKNELEGRGIAVNMDAMDKSRVKPEPVPEKPDLLVLMFAVHAFDASAPVYGWLNAADLSGARAAVVSVSGGGEKWPNTGCRNGVIGALEGRGATVTYEAMLIMPCNWVFPTGDAAAMHLLNYLPEKARKSVDGMLSGGVRRAKQRKGFMRAWVTKQEKSHAYAFAKGLKVSAGCTACGWCARHCPVQNITMGEGGPTFGGSCVMCFRCVYGCPARALKTKNFMVLTGGFDLGALEKRMQGVALPPVEQCFKGFFWKAARAYLQGKDEH